MRWAYAPLGTALLLYAVSTIVRPTGWHSIWLDDVLTNVIQLSASLLCLLRAFLVHSHRRAWAAFGTGLLLWSLGDLYWSVAFAGGAPGPSLADAGYLAFYPLAYLGIILLVRAQATRFPAPLWWDGVIAGLGAAATSAAFAFDTIQHATTGSPLTVAVNLSYPAGDLILVILAAGVLTLLRGRLELRWVLLSVASLLFAFADTGYLFQTAKGNYREGSLLDALWPAAIVLISWAGWQRPTRRRPLHVDGSLMLLAPLTAATAAATILVYGNLAHLGLVALALATATLAAAGIRMAVGFRDLRRLGETRRLALTDELTGLGNRRLLMQRLQEQLAAPPAAGDAALPATRLAILMVDLDRFKEVNDSFGHLVGDELLTQLGPRLRQVLRSADVLARLGGDEFAVLLGGADSDYALTVAQRISDALNEPFVLRQASVHTGASVGIALAPEHGHDAAELLRCADVAMYRAKASRTGAAVYDVTADTSRDRFQLAEELRDAISNQTLIVHYQPKVDLDSGTVHGVEALLRWPHPSRGTIPPDVFIPLAEEARLMRPLTHLVLNQALAQCGHWATRGSAIVVAVNLSATNLLDDDLPDDVAHLLAHHHVPPRLLTLEITETTLMADPPHARDTIARLKRLGVAISVDDFGTGFSSLAYLRDLPVDELKLDRAFVSRLGAQENRRDTALAHSALTLGHALGLTVVAEGVEDPDTLTVLTDLGFDSAQGYYLGRPTPPESVDFADRNIPTARCSEPASA